MTDIPVDVSSYMYIKKESIYPYTPFAYMYTFLCLHVHLPLRNLKFSLCITQLHTKFSRQFKNLHMILSNLFMILPHSLKFD